MTKRALYLTYRPSQLDDIVGQKYVVGTLKQASNKDMFAHAYLFSGNHGCGKTSSARILATLLNCENVSKGVLCGKCRACKTIPLGTSSDVKELDGATNRGIDDIKSLIESAQYSPQELKKKVYIIDEVHQLTKEATSALLKILEEPPSYLTFILCTTEIKKILPTILSRCQRFNFNKISSKDIAERLKHIADNEDINVSEDGCLLIGRISRGSMRDAVGYLDQIATLAQNKQITAQHIEKFFGVINRKAILNIIEAMKSKNLTLILDQVNDFIMAGVNAKTILTELSQVFRDIMILKIPNVNMNLVDLPDSEVEELKKIAESLKASHLIKLSKIFGDIERQIGYNINERWIMEATLLNCVSIINS